MIPEFKISIENNSFHNCLTSKTLYYCDLMMLNLSDNAFSRCSTIVVSVSLSYINETIKSFVVYKIRCYENICSYFHKETLFNMYKLQFVVIVIVLIISLYKKSKINFFKLNESSFIH